MPEAAAATPAAAPAPAAKPAPITTPSGKTPPAFDQRLALARSMGGPGASSGTAAPAADAGSEGADASEASSDTGADDPGEGASDASQGADASAEDAGEGGDDSADAGEGAATAGTSDERLEAAAKAFEAGDLEALGKALQRAGVKVTGPVARAFRAHKRRQIQLEAKEGKLTERERNFEESRARAQQEIAADSRRLSEAERTLTQKFGGAFSIQQAWDDQDAVALGKALEKACKGATLATITQMLASGKQGKTPEERAVAEERRKLEETKAADERKARQAEDQKRQATAREAAIGRVGEALRAHPYVQTLNDKGEKVQDTEALAEVFDLYEKSWNGEKFTKTARQCADELQAKLEARAKARGLAPAPATPPPPKAGSKPPQRKPAPRGAGMREPPRSSTTQRGTPQDLDASRAARIAQARRIGEMQRRGVR